MAATPSLRKNEMSGSRSDFGEPRRGDAKARCPVSGLHTKNGSLSRLCHALPCRRSLRDEGPESTDATPPQTHSCQSTVPRRFKSRRFGYGYSRWRIRVSTRCCQNLNARLLPSQKHVGKILKRLRFFYLHERHPLYFLFSKEPRRRKILREHHPPVVEHIVQDWIGTPQAQSIQNEDRWSVGGEGEFLHELSSDANLSDERIHVEHNNRSGRYIGRLRQDVEL